MNLKSKSSILLIAFFCLNLFANGANAKKSNESSAQSQSVATKAIVKEAEIKGMTCAFCVENLTKVFKKQDSVADVKIDLKSNKLTLTFKPGLSLDDDKIKKLVKASGYEVVSIHSN